MIEKTEFVKFGKLYSFERHWCEHCHKPTPASVHPDSGLIHCHACGKETSKQIKQRKP